MSCRRPNSVACDRVGLAVWLRHPARGVEAEIDGRRFALDDEKWSSGARMFAGFLERAGLRGDGALGVGGAATWHGDPPVRARVRLWIRHEGGRPLTTTVRVPLHPGWG